MKIKIISNTRLNSQHLEKDTIYDLEDKHAEYLIKLGRAILVNDLINNVNITLNAEKVEDIIEEPKIKIRKKIKEMIKEDK